MPINHLNVVAGLPQLMEAFARELTLIGVYWTLSWLTFFGQYVGHRNTSVNCLANGTKPATSWPNMILVYVLAWIWIPGGIANDSIMFASFLILQRGPSLFTLSGLGVQKFWPVPAKDVKEFTFVVWLLTLMAFVAVLVISLHNRDWLLEHGWFFREASFWVLFLSATLGQSSEIWNLRGDGPSRKSWIVDSSVLVSYTFSFLYCWEANIALLDLPVIGDLGMEWLFAIAIPFRLVMNVQHGCYWIKQRQQPESA